jgi:hypothetical protein
MTERLFDIVRVMSEVDAAEVLREICRFRPTRKMGVRPGSVSWEPITYVHGVDVSDLVDALKGAGLIVDTLHLGLQPTERGRAVAERLGPGGHLDLPLPPDSVID